MPLAEQDNETFNVLLVRADLNVPDAIAVAPDKDEEPLEKLHKGDSSVCK